VSENILVLSGSPRKGFNTDRLTDAFMDGVKAAGKSVHHFRVADMTIGGCKGCNYCDKHEHQCFQHDDMELIYPLLKKCDAVCFASPIYYFTISAQLKLALDRFYALRRNLSHIKKAALLVTNGSPGAGADFVSESAVHMFKQICDYLGWKNAGIVIAGGLHQKGEIEGNIALSRAQALGETI
jgi:multimeric flavodoxin WrbA